MVHRSDVGPTAAPTRAVAFFDLDRTLIRENSGLLYAKWERRHGRIGRRQLALGMWWGALYHLSLIDIDRALVRALQHYRGVHEAELARRTDQFFAEMVADRLLPGARAALQHHRGRGEPVVLLTNSSSYAAAAAVRAWGLDDGIGNHFTLDAEGRLDGEIVRPLCYGLGKVVRAQQWCQARGYDLAGSTFYTDSLSDLPMLLAVRNPVVVQPDPRLRLEARRRGWPIVDFRLVASQP